MEPGPSHWCVAGGEEGSSVSWNKRLRLVEGGAFARRGSSSAAGTGGGCESPSLEVFRTKAWVTLSGLMADPVLSRDWAGWNPLVSSSNLNCPMDLQNRGRAKNSWSRYIAQKFRGGHPNAEAPKHLGFRFSVDSLDKDLFARWSLFRLYLTICICSG